MRSFPTLLAAALLLSAPVAQTLATPPVPLPGAKLKLGTRYDPRIHLEVKGISTDATNGTSADATLYGGSIRIFSTVGDVFDHTYEMPASIQWHYYGLSGQNRGYEYKDASHVNGRIAVVRVRNGKMTRLIGSNLDFSLTTNPNPVNIVLRLGDRKYCMSFGGVSWKFVPGKKYLSLKAPAPAVCAGSPSGAFLDDAGL
jgi:hypothetical protein